MGKFDHQNGEQNEHQNMNTTDLNDLSFEDIIDRVAQIEKENQSTQQIKAQMTAMSDENIRLRQQIVACQNENQSLLDKYRDTLLRYQLLCKEYLKTSER